MYLAQEPGSQTEAKELLHPNVAHSLELDFQFKNRALRKEIVRILGGNEGAWFTDGEIAALTGTNLNSTQISLTQLVQFTEVYRYKLGYWLEKRNNGRIGKGKNVSYRLLAAEELGKRKRPLTKFIKDPEMPITRQMRKTYSSLLGGVKILERPPEDAMSRLLNSEMIHEEEGELDWFRHLLNASYLGLALNVRAAGIELDIKPRSSRYRNFPEHSLSQAFNNGFALAVVEHSFQALFFIDREDWEERLMATTPDDKREVTVFDRVLPFDPTMARSRFGRQVKRGNIKGEKEEALIRTVINRQAYGDPITTKEVIESGMMSDGGIDHMIRRSKRERFTRGFWVRVRGFTHNSKMQIMLLDRENQLAY